MLKVDRIDVHYGASRALKSVSLEAEPGRVTCVLGRNGVGKTTLMRAIVGQHPVSSGTVAWDDADITDAQPHRRAARGIAYVPQGREIFPLLTVEENLRTGFARWRARCDTCPTRSSPCSPCCATCWAGAAAIFRAASSSNWPSPGRW